MFEKSDSVRVSVSTGTIIRALLVLIGFLLIWWLRDLLMIVLTALVISSFVESSIPYFKKLRINRIFGVVLLYVFSVLIFAGLFYLFAPVLITEVYNFSSFLSTYFPGNNLLDFFQNDAFSGAKDIVAHLQSGVSLSGLVSVSNAFIANLSGGFFQTLSVAFGSIFNVILIILISFYFSIEEKGIENFLRIVLPIRYENYVVDLWARSQRKIALWVKGQMLLGVLIAVLTYLLLSLLGIQYALLLSIVAGILELIPYGIVVATVPAAAFAYISGGIPMALLVTGAYFIIHQFEVFLFAPLVIKKVVGLSPIVIILSAMIGLQLGGLWGMLLAIPFAVVFVEMTNDMEKRKIVIRANSKSS